MGGLRWWVLAFLAALVLAGSAGALLWLQRPRPAPTWSAPPPRARCPDVDRERPPVNSPAPTALVLLRGAGKVRLSLDGAPVAPGEPGARAQAEGARPVQVAAGEHVVRAEAEGAERLELTLRLTPFRPALVHAEQTAQLGLTLVWLGAECASCAAPAGRLSLDFTRTSAPDEEHLAEAAKALRRQDWPAAASRLRGVSPRSRQGAAFHRLAASAYQAAGQHAAARAELGALKGTEVEAQLAALVALERAEQAREQAQPLEQWNALTERFSRLLEEFALEAPGPVELATSRLAELSAGFLDATQRKDPRAQAETVRAADEALAQFVRALRRSRPEDCDFQARISAAAP